jgi:DNA-binding transcriptional regulator GbsR (MarR family)
MRFSNVEEYVQTLSEEEKEKHADLIEETRANEKEILAMRKRGEKAAKELARSLKDLNMTLKRLNAQSKKMKEAAKRLRKANEELKMQKALRNPKGDC